MAGIAEQLVKAIEDSGQTRYAISKGSGINQSMLSRLVNGERAMSFDAAERLADYLGLRIQVESSSKRRKRTMARSKNFAAQETFNHYLDAVGRADGKAYEDKATIYGDFSRLAVAFLAHTPPADLKKLYTDLRWKGAPNARAMHEAAKAWMAEHRPEDSIDE